MKRLAVTVLCLLLALGASCASGEQAITVTGLETETVTRLWEQSEFFARMQALTGVSVQAHAVTQDEEYQQMLVLMEQGVMPADVLFKANLTRAQERSLLESGALIDLAPLIERHMPNLSALLEAHPQWREIISLDDGRIASLPLLNTAERQICVWINRSWLDTLGIGVPQSLDELTDALLAMRDGDPNGNGKRDEAPLSLTGVFELRWLLPYFGVVADDYHLARDAQGSIVFAPELSAYRAFLQQLRDWFDMGLLTQENFTSMHSTAELSQSDDDTVTEGMLVTVTPYTHVSVDAVTQYEALLMPDAQGNVRWRDFLGEVWTGCFAVTSACDDPTQALRWADALYGEVGARLAYAGVEGVDYSFNEEGRWQFITGVQRDIEAIRSQVLIYTGATMPGLYPSAFIASVNSEVDRYIYAQSERAHAVSERVTPSYALDGASQARADELAVTLGALVDRGIARFATGELEITDENIAAWLEALREAGSDELVALYADTHSAH